ncbi:uncharacterized protein ALTATR162_LOCUS11287 [Alternaria atra]|uniref:F-box domain-containing protein n=1 Tax=Alternaria atra TaxID=119953 RepID=A0A8J2N521_9PLEO|nr:uncharacterized protein ALTATR162_LOCUS11287 [Alternaria atra]CAG5185368.1 unnamed protein product [Alternaria atra]
MAPKFNIPNLPLPTPYSRDTSPELGSPSKITQYNQKTGRPVRKSAGKIQKVPGYVDFEDSEFGTSADSELSELDEEDDMEPRSRSGNKKKGASKRKRSPSPPSPLLEPVILEQELDDLTDNEDGGAFHRNAPKKPPVTLQFNVPLGFHGPLFVKLDSTVLQIDQQGKLHEMQPGKSKKHCTVSPKPTGTIAVRPRGFTDLPGELRNTIYRYLFSRKDKDSRLRIPLKSNDPKDSLVKSAQFLRSCRLVHNEACSILYGENTFSFHRHYDTRGPYWEPVPKEIGYQDVLHFLKKIGPENVQYLRDVNFVFDDARPKDTPYVTSNEQRRYLNDDYLMNCLRILRDAKLRRITMYFGGRRQLGRTDVRFLGYLEQVKADEVSRNTEKYYHGAHRYMSQVAWNHLKEMMTRKKKLYEKE